MHWNEPTNMTEGDYPRHINCV